MSRPRRKTRRARRLTAREQERRASLRPPGLASENVSPARTPRGEVLAMLRRRGFHPKPTPADLPFPDGFDEARREAFARRLDHYAFRLFLRGAIQRPEGFRPADATRYVDSPAATKMAETLVALGLARPAGRARFALLHPPRSFGGTLEWYLARELEARLGLDTATGLRFAVPGVGGDLDVVAACEGRLVYLEAKSSPPRQIGEAEVAAFLERLVALRPDLALFVIDTALRLRDKAVPMLAAEVARRTGEPCAPRRILREVWALRPRLFVVGARGDLVSSVDAAIAHGLRGLTPAPLG